MLGIQAEVFMSLSKLANAPGCFSSPVIMILFLSPIYVSLIDTLTGHLNRRQRSHLHISCPSRGGLTIAISISYGQSTSNSPLLGLPYLVASWNRRTPCPLFLESKCLRNVNQLAFYQKELFLGCVTISWFYLSYLYLYKQSLY